MCLMVNKKETKKYDGETKLFKFYKVFEIHDGKLYTPYQGNRIKSYGIIKATGDLDIDFVFSKNSKITIAGGCCHAYIESCSGSNLFYLISEGYMYQLPIYVKSEDIIAVGENNDI